MKTLVVYYSAEGHTKKAAETIAAQLQADLFEIKPTPDYSSADLDWTNPDSRVSREHELELRDIKLTSTDVPHWSEYERIIIGYPIWWGIAAWPVNSFVKSVDWSDKIVYPFCTSHTSPLSDSDLLLKDDAKGGNWQDGIRFSQNVDPDKLKSWTDSL